LSRVINLTNQLCTCGLLIFSLIITGCETKPKPAVETGPKPAPRHWDIGDALVNHPLPPEVSDGYLEFAKSSSMGFGVTMAHDRISQRRHMQSDLLLYVHSGVARVTVGDKAFTAASGDIVFIPRGVIYYADALSKRQLELLTLYAPPLDPNDVEYLEPAERVSMDTTRKSKIITKTMLAPDSMRGDTANLEDEFLNMKDYQEIEDDEEGGK